EALRVAQGRPRTRFNRRPHVSRICVTYLKSKPEQSQGPFDEPAFTRKGPRSMQSDSSAASWVGIDVAQQWVDVVVLAGEQKVCQQRVERSSAALKGLAKTLLKHRPQ